ncbi:MAG: DUF1926 domain-containing protein [Candidatus Omnitrophica bacterium]|nr:DUF1926 domain-containing protein [Candidatus Omnitrophota bacterium]
MPNRINLLLVIHCHQPVGNFGSVFEEAYNKVYLPFIKVLADHPRIKVALHYSGCLLDWIKEKKPEFLEQLKKMAKSGQVEIVSGGYYEPILPLIPDRDKLGQLKMHMDYVKKMTGNKPEGAWLTERVWEPYLAKIFSQAGLSYTVVDDSHFEMAGKKGNDILGYYLTEDDGLTLAIFPSSKKLRYNLPFKLPHETIDYLRSVATPDGTRAVTFGDDGEKFGLWPKTYKWVYEEKWLDNFFTALEANLEWINVITPSEYMKKYEPLGRLYIPCASYPEMLEWSGGYFRNFLVKYPEANWMQKRMLYASERLKMAEGEEPAASKGLKKAREALYSSQCNCAYWHGVFGGLYLHHLRAAIYKNIIDAEKGIDDSRPGKAVLRTEAFDIDKDGSDEIVFENGIINLYLDPGEGGCIQELDYRPRSVNLINTLRRSPEAYHQKIKSDNTGQQQKGSDGVSSIHEVTMVKEKNLGEFLNYDRRGKSCMIEHFLAADSNPENFSKAAFGELGDFSDSRYDFRVKKEKNSLSVSLERKGMIASQGGQARLKLTKDLRIEAKKPVLYISYGLISMADQDMELWFGSEFNFTLMDPALNRIGALEEVNRLAIKDEWFKLPVEFSLNKTAGVWFYPVETVSESESGLEKTYQELCLLFHWRLNLKARQAWSAEMSFEIK